MTAVAERPLGRLEPTDFVHVDRYPLGEVLPTTVDTVERLLQLPGWRTSHDQGHEGSCVGHAVAIERAMTNRAQLVALGKRVTVRYDPLDVWNRAKAIDEWDYTKPGDQHGTSVRAAYAAVAAEGLRPVRTMRLDANGNPTVVGARELDVSAGVAAYRWASTVDEIRTAIATGLPVAIGVAWFRSFDSPSLEQRAGAWWIKNASGGVRGGHAVTLYGASDRRQAFRLCNSWGRDYPLVWLPFDVMALLLQRGGEAAVVTDR